MDDVDKIEKELAEIAIQFFTDSQLKAANVTFNGRTSTVYDFKKDLQDQVDKIKSKDIKSVYQSTLFGNLDYLGSDPEVMQDELQRELASLERQIVERENNIIDIDTYVAQLVTNKEGARFTMQHTNAKFIKIAEDDDIKSSKDDMIKEADEEIEDYYNDLYEGSEGSPDYGTALEHPEETIDQLSTEIRHHKFKKK